jgi:hypothetical protein
VIVTPIATLVVEQLEKHVLDGPDAPVKVLAAASADHPYLGSLSPDA